jgi:transcription factor IIIB 90 kDa subunit
MNLFKNVKNNDYIKYKTTHRTKGRNTEMVAAACLYMACRIEKYPLLLIDFLSATETQMDYYQLADIYQILSKEFLLEDE